MSNSLREIPKSEHGIARKAIGSNALKVIGRLQEAGFAAYVVGGGPRDLLLGQCPKDFDVSTGATPEEIRNLFRNARLIGRRFRLAHIRFGREIIEVATFRGSSEEGDRELDGGRLLRDNVFGSEAEDAVRRDFTINALMYDPSTEKLRDYVDGFTDIRNRRLRLIGDPVTRFREDPVRLLRAVRFVTKLNLSMDPATAGPVVQMAPLLADIPPPRLLEELLKLLLAGHAWPGYQRMAQLGLWQQLFPDLIPDPESPPELVKQALLNTDERVARDKPVTPGFLFAALFWLVVKRRADELLAAGAAPVEALARAGEEAFTRHTGRVSIHRRFSTMAKEIWMFQPRFERRYGKRAMRLLSERRFRAAYDFLVLRGLEDPELSDLVDWWTRVQEVDQQTREQMIFETGRKKPPPRTRPRP